MSRNTKALVLWTKESKTGIEPISNVPESSRFPGAMSSVRFSGDKKWYPAKILTISDDQEELEIHAVNVETQIMNDKEKEKLPSKRRRGGRGKQQPELPTVASERNIAQALGSKRPMPSQVMEEAKKATQKANKALKVAAAKGQSALEKNVASSVRKNLMYSLSGSKQGPAPPTASTTPTLLAKRGEGSESESSGEESPDDEQEGGVDDDITKENAEDCDSDGNDLGLDEHDGSDTTETSMWCSNCKVCTTLQKYDDVSYYSFLSDLLKLYEKNISQEGRKQYLKLKVIPEGVRTVELKKDSGVWIRADTKNQLKVDFKNKSSTLIRETLYALYGEEALRTCKVTGRGCAEGTFTLAPDVLSALRSFVNNNIPKEKALTIKKLVGIINKRAPEWRKANHSKQTRKKMLSSTEPGVISTSPFKATPLKTPIIATVETGTSELINPVGDGNQQTQSSTEAATWSSAFPSTAQLKNPD